MASSHLLPARHHHGNHEFVRAIIVLAIIIVLIALCATRVHATVTRAESGDHIKPMPVAQYLKIKAQIRGRRMYYHAHPRPQVRHWVANTSSGWQDPWPK